MEIGRRSYRFIVIATVVGLMVASCKKKDETAQAGYPPQQQYPQQQYPQQQYPQQYPQQQPYQPAPWAPPAQAMAPAFGFFCQTDNDMQCPYGRCIGGRCGGCSDANQCKRGAGCAPSPVGGTCWPGAAPAPAPPAPPQPPPQPGPTPTQPPPFPGPPSSSDAFAGSRQSCVDRINAYRSRLRLPALARDAGSEPCADEESRADARSNRPHGTFGKCGERAQNACPNYPGATAEDVMNKCLQQMFDEGPGGGHYDNMTSTKYSRAYCGFEQMAGGRIWAIQNFR